MVPFHVHESGSLPIRKFALGCRIYSVRGQQITLLKRNISVKCLLGGCSGCHTGNGVNKLVIPHNFKNQTLDVEPMRLRKPAQGRYRYLIKSLCMSPSKPVCIKRCWLVPERGCVIFLQQFPQRLLSVLSCTIGTKRAGNQICEMRRES